ncbi:MAG TPA: metallohydrolase [Alcanivorax sp.]|nr:metallohydrolase [Alcanivorax sp.]
MTSSITFFPVGCGDMSLVQLADGSSIIIDINIRKSADDSNDDAYPDVVTPLRDKLKADLDGRPYVDAFLLSHPDEDHCKGLMKHFYLGKLEDYPDDNKAQSEKRIIIREMWSSPLVFRRATSKAESEGYSLCDDASAWAAEARRRAKINKETPLGGVGAGDRLLIMGEDENGKTDDLQHILVKRGEKFNQINGRRTWCFEASLLAPLAEADKDDEAVFSKNDSSVVINIQIAADDSATDGCRFLTGGDAKVGIWRKLWQLYKGSPVVLEYDLLQAPHHCSWGSLSEDSWSKGGDSKTVSEEALNALSQARSGAQIISSSKPIKEDDADPPCIGAKDEYVKIVNRVKGEFFCTGEHPGEDSPAPLTFEITPEGPQPPAKKDSGRSFSSMSIAAKRPIEHG